MGNHLIWEDRFNIGIASIDREHKKLFRIINKLFTFSEQEVKGPWVCQEGIKYFKEHALAHFAEEEAYMASISYQGLKTHRRLHEDFSMRTLPALENELEKSGYAKESIQHFLGVCAGWLIGHTLTEDRAIVGKESSKWLNLMPEEEQFVVKQTIIRLLHEMFGLTSEVLSECYGGERFGTGIYFRLIYGSDGKQREIILVFEEKLLIHTVGCDTKSLNLTVWRQCRPNHPFRWMKPLSPALPVMALFGSGHKRNPIWNPNREGRMKLRAAMRLGCRLSLIAWLIN